MSLKRWLLFLFLAMLALWSGGCAVLGKPEAAVPLSTASKVSQLEGAQASEAPSEEDVAPLAPVETASGALPPAEAGQEFAYPFPTPGVILPAATAQPEESSEILAGTATAEPTFSPPTASPAVEEEPEPNSPTPPAAPEDRTLQVDWPRSIRLGESDVVSLKLVPAGMSYLLVSEFPDHQEITHTVTVTPYAGYELFSAARLDGANFEVSPGGEQVQFLPAGQPVEWRWSVSPISPGDQRLSIRLTLRWVPVSSQLPVRDLTVYSAGLDVRVASLLGLTQPQALLGGLSGLLLAGSLGLVALLLPPGQAARETKARPQTANAALKIDLPSGLSIAGQERALLMSLFHRYARLIIRQEFKSGYSGGRTFLALPIRPDGRSDAFTIAKLGDLPAIIREFKNYEAYVKDRLPPITARIQHEPVKLPVHAQRQFSEDGLTMAALRYTFIGEPGESPISLSQYLSNRPDPGILYRLFETFGPGWWLQRQPYTFRLGEEYDRVLPAHYVMEPVSTKGQPISRELSLDFDSWQAGEIASLKAFRVVEVRHDRKSLSLQASNEPGRPPVRVRWLGNRFTEGSRGRILSTRRTLLEQYTAVCDLHGLPDPLDKLPMLLERTVAGSRSVIHGDLNLENALAGPGNMLWLIDFAQTREGHTLFDFAHLEAEIIAHLAARRIHSGPEYLRFQENLSGWQDAELASLVLAIRDIASRCLFNPANPAEYFQALAVTCLGALKFTNLDQHSRHLLYLTAAFHLK